MKIYYPEDFFSLLRGKHLLLDTNVFIDSFNFDRPVDYIKFFNNLKDNDTTLATIDGVVLEFLKGSKNEEVFNRKKEHLDDITDIILPTQRDDSEKIKELIRLYQSDGGGIEIVDYYLGANLLRYRKNLCLMTRNTRDFPQNIFSLISTISFSSFKTIFTYGIYTYDHESATTPQTGLINPDDIPF